MKAFHRFKAGALILLIAGCLPGGIDTGMNGGSSAPQGVRLQIRLPSGQPAGGTGVKLFASKLDPSVSDSGILISESDTQGRTSFPGLKSAYYNAIARDTSRGLWAFAESLQVSEKVISLTLSVPLQVEFHLLTAASRPDSGILFFPGTDILIHCKTESPCFSGDIPRGIRKAIARAASGWQATLIWEGGPGAVIDTLSMSPTDTLHIDIGPDGPHPNP